MHNADACQGCSQFAVALCIGLSLAVVCVAGIGILGTRSSVRQGSEVASDELATSTVMGELARDMDMAYSAGQAAFLESEPAERSRLLGSLYTRLLPATDARLSALERLHAHDPPGEQAGIRRFVRQ
jgi:hypothetical protein